jgi:predicted NBD/HSP70 family sugar kinase
VRFSDNNQSLVLESIRLHGPISRRDISAATRLTFQTIANITERLMAARVVTESATRSASRSRLLMMNAKVGFALGIEVNRSHAELAMVDLQGEVVARDSLGFELGTPAEAVPKLVAAVDSLIHRSGAARAAVLGMGVATPGPLSPPEGRLLDPVELPGWSQFPLASTLQQALGFPVRLHHKASSGAMGELWRGFGVKVKNFVYLHLGVGIDSGIVADGELIGGASGNAGNIGHIVVDPQGPLCVCGKRGCLFAFLGAAEGLAGEELQLAGRHLADAAWGLTRVLDSELVILGGPSVAHHGDFFASALRQNFANVAGPPGLPRVEVAGLGADAIPVGAASLVLHEVLEPSVVRIGALAAA